MKEFQPPSLIISAASHRSGSTWVQRIVHAATDIFVWGEPFPLIEVLFYAYSVYKDQQVVRSQEYETFMLNNQDPTIWVANISPPLDHLKRSLSLFLSEYFGGCSNKSRYGWKEIRYGRDELAFLRELFPDLKIILLVRNPIDVVRSLKAQGWLGRWRDTENIQILAQHWNTRVQGYLQISQQPNTLLLKYENVPIQLDRLLAFIGGQYNPRVEQALNVKVGSSEALPVLTSEEEKVILEHCAEPMKELGYLEALDIASSKESNSSSAVAAVNQEINWQSIDKLAAIYPSVAIMRAQFRLLQDEINRLRKTIADKETKKRLES